MDSILYLLWFLLLLVLSVFVEGLCVEGVEGEEVGGRGVFFEVMTEFSFSNHELL